MGQIKIYGRVQNTSEPIGGCLPGTCRTCDEKVWLPLADVEKRRGMAAEERPVIICQECADAAEEAEDEEPQPRPGVYSYRCGAEAITVGPDEHDQWKIGIGAAEDRGGLGLKITDIRFVGDLAEKDARHLVSLLDFMQLDAMYGFFIRTGETQEMARMLTRAMINLMDFDGAKERLRRWEESFVAPGSEES